MFAKNTFLLSIVLALMGVAPVQADDAADRAKLLETLMTKEKDSWEMIKKKDLLALKDFFGDDVILIFSDATRYNKADYLKLLPDYKLESYAIEGKADLLLLTPDAATVVYRINYTSEIKDEKPRKVTVLASSSYARRDGKWLNVFYQETQKRTAGTE